MAHPDRGRAQRQRGEQGDQAAARARGDVGEQPAPCGDQLRGGRLGEQVGLGQGARGVAPGGVRVRGRVVGHEGVRLGEHHVAEVDDPGRQRLGEAAAERSQGQRHHRDPGGVSGVRVDAVRAADHEVGLAGQRRVVGHRQPQAPGRTQPDGGQPVRRQVDEHQAAALEVQLVLREAGGLRDPVGVRRHRQLDALPGGVVVEGHQRAGGVGAQQGLEDCGKASWPHCTE